MSKSQHHLALPAGTQISSCVIDEVRSAGGFGLVYLGHRIDAPHEKVAIKEYLPRGIAERDSSSHVKISQGDDDFSSQEKESYFEENKRKFIDEASILTSLYSSSPNLVRIFGHDHANNTVYLIMEYLPGQTLQSHIENPDSQKEISVYKKILIDLLGALKHVHDKRIWHRDIKPANIMFRTPNTPVLIDFGAARLDLNPKVTAFGLQTPAYAAPEQVSSGQIGPWTDLYSLAATFYHVLSGRYPLDSRSRLEEVDSHQTLSDKPISEARGESEVFLASLDKAMALDSADRFPDAQKWLDVLHQDVLTQKEPRPSDESADGYKSSKKQFFFGVFVSLVAVAMLVLKLSNSPLTPGKDPENSKGVSIILIPGFVAIPAGKFVQGSDAKVAKEDEKPEREVRVAEFYLSETEVTFEMYAAYALETKKQLPDDEGWGRGKRPVINVTWQNATEYAKWFGELHEEFNCALPTESEWEYASRVNTSVALEKSIAKESAVFETTKTSSVKSKQYNERKLYDMYGNVWEWVQDCYVDNYDNAPADGSAVSGEMDCKHVLRGGAFDSDLYKLRPTYRGVAESNVGGKKIGFRVLCRTD